MKNLMKNGIPMIFPREEGKLQAKYYYKVMQNGDVGVFIQALSVGDPKAIKLWPKVSKVIYKNINDFFIFSNSTVPLQYVSSLSQNKPFFSS